MMPNISEGELFEYFKRRSNPFTNTEGMQLGLTAVNEIWTDFSLCNHDDGPLAISISTGEDIPSEFIEGFKLTATEDIDRLNYTSAWMRYLNGNAEISVHPLELEAILTFTIVRRKTTICSLDLHFYDEVYEHLTLVEDFERYISSHENMLYLAAANRYKMNRRR